MTLQSGLKSEMICGLNTFIALLFKEKEDLWKYAKSREWKQL